MQQLFTLIYDLLHSRKKFFWLVFLSSLAIWIFFAAQINLKQDIADMLPDDEGIQAMNEVMGKTETGEQLIFLIADREGSTPDPDELAIAARDLATTIKNDCHPWIDSLILEPGGESIEEAILSIIQNHLPVFLTDDDYRKIDEMLDPESVDNRMANTKKLLISPASVIYKKMVANDPIGMSNLVWQKLQTLQTENSYEIYNGYLYSDSGRKLNFFLRPKYKAAETGKNREFINVLNQSIENWMKASPQWEVYYFGGPAVAAGNAAQMQSDTILTLSLTIILLIAVTYYFFRRKRIPILLLIPVVYGAAMGLGLAYLIQGSMSVIALGAGAIILGIAIDFSIHFLAHARTSGDLRETVSQLAHPLTIGSFTTIAAFLSLQLADTPLLNDLGLFAAASLTGAALCTLIFLPHLPLGTIERKHPPTLFDKFAGLQPEKNKILILVILCITPILLYFSFGVGFDNNLMNLNYLSPQLKKAQEEVSKENAAALSSMFVISNAKEFSEALEKLEAAQYKIDSLTNSGTIRATHNPVTLIPSNNTQIKRIEKWQHYWTDERKQHVTQVIHTAALNNGFNKRAFENFTEGLTKPVAALDSGDIAILKRLFPAGFATSDTGNYIIASLQVPEEYRSTVMEQLKTIPEITVTDRQQGAVALLRILNDDFNNIALYSSLIVFFALLIGYGRIELAIMSFLPMAISWIWILGIMALLGLEFNIVNIIISTLIFGLGDDYTIFTTDGLIEKYKKGTNKLKSVRAAVYLSVVTVIIGLGVLLLAKHPALKSIAFISVVGIICVVFISQTLQPFLFNLWIQNRADKRLMPLTLWSILKSLFAFVYFVIGSIVLTIIGFICTRLWPINKLNGRKFFHLAIKWYSWSMMYVMGNVRKRILNKELLQYDKPAIYIANHSSFIDILCILSLHPRLVMLTNKWVWNSPIFGALIRMAQFYPVVDGVADNLDPMRKLVNEGYSIMIFPEGTRSETGRIKRFHKGAFYLAEQLQLSIIPILLHGFHYTMQKGDWLLKDGSITIKIYPEIKSDDPQFGNNYSERARYIGRWMRAELTQFKEQNETPTYFREQLIRSYTYKGPVLEWYCRIKTKLDGNYELYHSLIPKVGRFYDLGCGYGYMSYLLHWAAPERIITGVDYDAEKIETAAHNYLRDEQINFVHADLVEHALEPADGIFIIDMLHYLLPEQQKSLLEKSTAALNPGGKLIVRDGVKELEQRHATTRLTEVLSTKVVSFNKTQNELHFISRAFMEEFANRHGLKLEIIDPGKITSNLVFVMSKQ